MGFRNNLEFCKFNNDSVRNIDDSTTKCRYSLCASMLLTSTLCIFLALASIVVIDSTTIYAQSKRFSALASDTVVSAPKHTADPGEKVTVTIDVADLPAIGLGTATIEIGYDPAILSIEGCTVDPGKQADIKFCNPRFDADGIGTDSLRFNLSFFSGQVANFTAAQIEFQVVGGAGTASVLDIRVQTFADIDGADIAAVDQDGAITIPGDGQTPTVTLQPTVVSTADVTLTPTPVSTPVSTATPTATPTTTTTTTNPLASTIGHIAFNDSDGDGIRDTDELGMAGVVVTLFDTNYLPIDQVTTDENGFYLFQEVAAGKYFVVFDDVPGFEFSPQNQGEDETVDSDVDANGNSGLLLLASGQTIETLDAGLRSPDIEPATLGDMVFHDLNANGIQDENEVGYAGMSVHLLDSQGEEAGQTTTDAEGSYRFTDIAPGAYRLRFNLLDEAKVFTAQDAGTDDTVDSDANQATGFTAWLDLGTGEVDDSVDVGLRDAGQDKPATVGNFIFEDLNGNGVQDEGEPGVQEAAVHLLDQQGNVLHSLLTGPTGEYYFFGMDAGTYMIQVDLPDGFASFTKQDAGVDDAIDSDVDPEPDSPTFGQTAPIFIGLGEQNLSLDAGLINLVSLGDFVWEDLDMDGVQDQGEPGLADAVVTLLSSTNQVISTTTTNTEGFYQFTALPPGIYAIQVTADDFHYTNINQGDDDTVDSDVSPVSGISGPIQLLSGANDITVDAGLVLNTAKLGDFVWLDQNGNGRQDADEPGVAEMPVHLLDSNGTVILTTITDQDGSYHFTNLLPGSYTVQFILPTGYQFTVQNQGSSEAGDSDADLADGKTDEITLLPGQNNPNIDAGVIPLGSIGDFVWLDQNSNGLQDVGEPGIGDVFVELFNPNGEVVNSTTSNPDGSYVLTNVEEGDYSLNFSNLPDGVTVTLLNQGNDEALDNDVGPDGSTPIFTLNPDQDNGDIDAGLAILNPGQPAIDLQKLTNGEDADRPTGPILMPGNTVTWRYIVQNIGDVPLNKIVLTDDQIGTIQCPSTSLDVGEEMVCIEKGVATLGQYRNDAVVEASGGQPAQSVSAADSSHYLGEEVDLAITKSDGMDPMEPGKPLSYTLVYTNFGPSDAVNVTITDQLPFGVYYQSVISQDSGLDGPSITIPRTINQGMNLVWTLDRLAAGESGKIVFLVGTDFNLGGATITNQVLIESETLEGDITNNEDSEETTFVIGGTDACCITAIDLLHFGATERQGQMQVRWVTVAELDTFGFHLYRSKDDNFDNAIPITESMILGQGSQGGEYTFIDPSAQNGLQYYWLVEIAADDEEEVYGPVMAEIEVSASTLVERRMFFLPLVQR